MAVLLAAGAAFLFGALAVTIRIALRSGADPEAATISGEGVSPAARGARC